MFNGVSSVFADFSFSSNVYSTSNFSSDEIGKLSLSRSDGFSPSLESSYSQDKRFLYPSPELEETVTSQNLNSYPILPEIHASPRIQTIASELHCPFTSSQNLLKKSYWSRDDLSKISFPKVDVKLIHRFHKESTFGFQKPGILADLQRARKDRIKEIRASSHILEETTADLQPILFGEHLIITFVIVN